MGTNRLLKRPNGYLLAAFSEGVSVESIRQVAEADRHYLRAVEREQKFASHADAESVFMFAWDVREARTKFLVALEEAYNG